MNAKNEFNKPDDQDARNLARYIMDKKKLSDYSMHRSRKNDENKYDKPEYTTERAQHFKDWKKRWNWSVISATNLMLRLF